MHSMAIVLMNSDVLVMKSAAPTAGMSAALTTGLSEGCSLINCAAAGP